MATVSLVTKFAPYVDEQFSAESKRDLLTNKDYSWEGAHSIKLYKITTAEMNDYGRTGASEGNWSRYGEVDSLDATTEELILSKDRSFTFAIDKLDQDETVNQLEAASALARQMREVVIPEVDSYVYNVMCTKAGTKPTAAALTADNLYGEILKGTQALDGAMVPETQRCIVVTPDTYTLMKKCKDIAMETDIGNDMRLKGVIGILDGCSVIKVPAVRLPKQFGFMVCHPVATVAPLKLEDYVVHYNPPDINGSLVEGRIVYDAFVLDNKTKAIYYHALPDAG